MASQEQSKEHRNKTRSKKGKQLQKYPHRPNITPLWHYNQHRYTYGIQDHTYRENSTTKTVDYNISHHSFLTQNTDYPGKWAMRRIATFFLQDLSFFEIHLFLPLFSLTLSYALKSTNPAPVNVLPSHASPSFVASEI